jgi:hypothetical protein
MDVRSYQEALAALGHYKGKIDGLHGPLTIKAIKAFQTVNGLWPTGIMDVPTKAKLAPATTKLLYTPSEPRWMIEARKHQMVAIDPRALHRRRNPVVRGLCRRCAGIGWHQVDPLGLRALV